MILSIERVFLPLLWEAEGKIGVSERRAAPVWSPAGVGRVDTVHRKEWFTSLQPSAPIINTMDHRRARLPLSHIWTTPSPVRQPLSPSLAGTSVSCTKPPGRRRFTWCHSAQSSRGVAMRRFFGHKCVTFVVRYHGSARIKMPLHPIRRSRIILRGSGLLTLVSASPREIAPDASRSREACVRTQS